MTEFKLDTSGTVWDGITDPREPNAYFLWSDLSPFVRGYIEALFSSPDFEELIERELAFADDEAETDDPKAAAWARRWRDNPRAFSYLAPEALARIIADGEAFQATSAFCPLRDLVAKTGSWSVGGMTNAGREFWHVRSGQEDYAHGFKPGDWPAFSAEPLNVAARSFPPLTVTLNDAGKVVFTP